MAHDEILILGCGNMGGAMLTGWLAGGMAPGAVTVVDPMLARAPDGVELLRALPEGRQFETVLLGVKPQLLDAVAPQLSAWLTPRSTLLSILAGVDLATLAARFPQAGAVVRVMPNLAAAIGKSPVVMAGHGLDAGARARISALMEPLGTPEWLADDHLFDAVTALAGSGPGFVYRFIDALAAGGAELGLDPDQAGRIALATVEGAAALAAAAPVSPAELARQVASPGGTTEQGLNVLDADQALARLIAATLCAARDRGAAMAAAAREAQG